MATEVGEGYIDVEPRLNRIGFNRQLLALQRSRDAKITLRADVDSKAILAKRAEFRRIGDVLAKEFTVPMQQRIAKAHRDISTSVERDRKIQSSYAAAGDRAATAFAREMDDKFKKTVIKALTPDIDKSRVDHDLNLMHRTFIHHGDRFGKTLGNHTLRAFEGIMSLLPSRLETVFTRTGPIIGSALLAGLAGSLAIGLPALGAMISGALFAGLGTGVVAAGIALVASNPAVKKAANRLRDTVWGPDLKPSGNAVAKSAKEVQKIQKRISDIDKFGARDKKGVLTPAAQRARAKASEDLRTAQRDLALAEGAHKKLVAMGTPLKSAARAFVKPTVAAINEFGNAFQRWIPQIQRMFNASSKFVQPMAKGLIALIDGFITPMTRIIESSFMRDLMNIASAGFGQIGQAIGDFFGRWLTDPRAMEGAKLGLRDLFDLLSGTIRLSGDLLRALSRIWFSFNKDPDGAGPAISKLDQMRDIWRDIKDFLDEVGGKVGKIFGKGGTFDATNSLSDLKDFVEILKKARDLSGASQPKQTMTAMGGPKEDPLKGQKSKQQEAMKWFKNQWKDFVGELGTAWDHIKQHLAGGWDQIKAKWKVQWEEILQEAEIWRQKFGPIWQNVAGSFRNSWTSVASWFRNTWTNEIAETARNGWTNVANFLRTIWTNIASWFRNKWTEIWGTVKTYVANIGTSIRSGFNSTRTFIVDNWNAVKNFAAGVWNSITSTVAKALRNISLTVGRVLNTIRGAWVDAWTAMKTFLGGVWNGITGAVTRGFNGVIGILNRGIGSINSVLDKLGIKQRISAIPLIGVGTPAGDRTGAQRRESFGRANGGRVTGPGGPKEDKIPAMLSNGEFVMNARSTRKNLGLLQAMNSGKVATFADGGLVGGLVGNIEMLLSPWATILKKTLNPVINKLGGGMPNNALGWLGSGMGKFLGKQIVPWIKKMFDTAVKTFTASFVRGGGGGGAGRWAGTVAQALALLHLPGSWLGPTLTLIGRESGGNPNAINLWDINAKRGDPSRGLMQTIGATFAAYRMPGLSSNIYDPLSNIVAGLRYIRSRYGTIFNVQQAVGATPRGYDTGGWLPQGTSLVRNSTSHPELVLNHQQQQSLGGPTYVTVYLGDEILLDKVQAAVEGNNAKIAQAFRRGRG